MLIDSVLDVKRMYHSLPFNSLMRWLCFREAKEGVALGRSPLDPRFWKVCVGPRRLTARSNSRVQTPLTNCPRSPYTESEIQTAAMDMKTYSFKVIVEREEDFDGNPSGC